MSCSPNHTLCERCKRTTSDMARHWRRDHGERWRFDVSMTGVASTRCPQTGCFRSFGSQRALDAHVLEHHPQRLLETADPSGSLTSNPDIPSLREEPTVATTFTCSDCDHAPFVNEHALQVHQSRMKHGPYGLPEPTRPDPGEPETRPRKPGAKGPRGSAPKRSRSTSTGHIELTGAEATLISALLSSRELQGSTIAELTADDHVAIALAAKLEASTP